MASMVIGGHAFTGALEVCSYVFKRFPITEQNGNGELVGEEVSEVTLTYAEMEPADYAWWTDTICAGLPSKTYTSATLYNDRDTTESFTNLVVDYPTYDGISGAYYQNVTVKIREIA
jgi:hypothetical protein